MSRYFQSTYHGSSDYKKYREERLAKNSQIVTQNTKRPYTQSLPFRQQSSRPQSRERLQTFGKQTGRSQIINHQKYQVDYKSIRQSSNYLRDQNSEYRKISPINNHEYKRDLDLKIAKDDKITKYMQDRYKAFETSVQYNDGPKYDKQLVSQQRQNRNNWKGDSRNREPNLSYRKNNHQRSNPDSFQEAVISRTKHYDYRAKLQTTESITTSKTYNYPNRLQKKQPQVFQCKKLSDTDRGVDYGLKSKQKAQISSYQTSTPPYRNRNEIIKQRLNAKDQSQTDTYQGIRQDSLFNYEYERKGLQTRRQQIGLQTKTTLVTPQKSPLSLRDDRNASQQRRKSLIEKSQMLKQKLNRLNASSNRKVVENQENYGKQTMQDKQNLAQNYTPKRYSTKSFTMGYDNVQNTDKSVSKRLNFENHPVKTGPLNTIHKNGDQQIQSATKNYSTNLITRSIRSGTTSKQTVDTGDAVGEGALKKISELNERINSRLQSILKNYG